MPHPAYWALHHHAAKHGCFVATASFGTPLEPEVILLKDFRDRFLMTKTVGRLFVQMYYHTSPPIARLISKSERLKRMTRALLKPLVRYARKELSV